MKLLACIGFCSLASLALANDCTDELKQWTMSMSFEQFRERVKDELNTDPSSLRSIEPVNDFKQGDQFYQEIAQFKRTTTYFRGDALNGEYLGVSYSGNSVKRSPFGLFLAFDIKTCELKAVSYDVPVLLPQPIIGIGMP